MFCVRCSLVDVRLDHQLIKEEERVEKNCLSLKVKSPQKYDTFQVFHNSRDCHHSGGFFWIWCVKKSIKLKTTAYIQIKNNVFIFDFLSIYLQASALRCWMCNSKDDPGCGDPFNSHIISSSLFVECPYVALGKSLCIKAKSTSKYCFRMKSLSIYT